MRVEAHAGMGMMRTCSGCMISVLCMGVLCMMHHRREGYCACCVLGC